MKHKSTLMAALVLCGLVSNLPNGHSDEGPTSFLGVCNGVALFRDRPAFQFDLGDIGITPNPGWADWGIFVRAPIFDDGNSIAFWMHGDTSTGVCWLEAVIDPPIEALAAACALVKVLGYGNMPACAI